jgi:hypothetical protein
MKPHYLTTDCKHNFQTTLTANIASIGGSGRVRGRIFYGIRHYPIGMSFTLISVKEKLRLAFGQVPD